MNVLTADLLVVAVILLVTTVVLGTMYLRYRRATNKLEAQLETIFAMADAAPRGSPQVNIRFHLYSGWLVSFDQVCIERTLPAAAAPGILRELMLLNFGNLALCHGMVFVPFLTWFEYRGQLRSVRRQVRQLLPTSVRLEAERVRVFAEDREVGVFDWYQVQSIRAWKQDLFAVDLIWLGFETSGGDDLVCVHGEVDGYKVLIEEMERRCAGLDADWWSRVAFPPFVESPAVVWRQPEPDAEATDD